MKKFLMIFIATLSLSLSVAFLGRSLVLASPLDATKNEICAGANSSNTTCPSGSSDIDRIITSVIDTISAIVGVIAVIMLIYGGFRYVTSGGDSGQVSAAKNTIIYAIVGLLIVMFAQIIVQFVLNKVTS